MEEVLRLDEFVGLVNSCQLANRSIRDDPRDIFVKLYQTIQFFVPSAVVDNYHLLERIGVVNEEAFQRLFEKRRSTRCCENCCDFSFGWHFFKVIEQGLLHVRSEWNRRFYDCSLHFEIVKLGNVSHIRDFLQKIFLFFDFDPLVEICPDFCQFRIIRRILLLILVVFFSD